ncbi:hypothetical protein ACSNOK_12435 [Streptomyces sp. URMC 126]|uniref:hypothetical protein n=1 Tax=Streptomyces sp. URMC 126 TaxID=3423401 RepID=UPI003F1E40C3
MSTAPPPPSPSTSGRSGWCCCLLIPLLPVVWLLATSVLPERVFWFPFWLGAVLWNGSDGQGGIHHLLG